VIEVKGGDKQADYQFAKKNHNAGDAPANEILAKELGFQKFRALNRDFEYKIVFNAKLSSRQFDVENVVRDNSDGICDERGLD
jgi:hypothetical protein